MKWNVYIKYHINSYIKDRKLLKTEKKKYSKNKKLFISKFAAVSCYYFLVFITAIFSSRKIRIYVVKTKYLILGLFCFCLFIMNHISLVIHNIFDDVSSCFFVSTPSSFLSVCVCVVVSLKCISCFVRNVNIFTPSIVLSIPNTLLTL